MYRKLIEAMIENYINRYSVYNNDIRTQRGKWYVALQFKKNWDINATDFREMWKRCTDHGFIGTMHGNPASGIDQLLRRDEEVEGVREAFRNLFADDHGDLTKRQTRIDDFIAYINGRLTETGIGTFNKQQKDAVITYLNLYAPDDNYRFKAEPAAIWADYMDVPNWGRGKFFSLAQYYKMCDQLRNIVCQHDGLLRLQKQHFSEELLEVDKEYHILTFDVLYCAWDSVDYMSEVKQHMIADEKERKRAIIRLKISNIIAQIDELNESKVPFTYQGLTVVHKNFGEGTASVRDEKYLDVTFQCGVKHFALNNAVSSGFLSLKDEKSQMLLNENQVLDLKIEMLNNELTELNSELATIV